ncbi:MAG: ABC transporter permease [Acidimicrobiales bacterium]
MKSTTRALPPPGETDADPPAPQSAEARPANHRLVRLLVSGQSSVVGLVLLIVVTWTVFGTVGSGFLTSFNLYSIGQLAARDAVLGMAQAILVVMARMNLAVGSVGAICVSLLGYMLVVAHIALPVAILVIVVAGVLASLVMGIVELKTGLSSFIVTLAFLSAYGGGALLITRNANYEITSSVLDRLGSGTFLSAAICPLVAVAVICGVVVWLVYNKTAIGWKMLAVGANERAARASGVNAPRVLLAGYALSGLLCAVAALMESSYELNVNASIGTNWLLPSFIAVVLGGVALAGGDITVAGILLAALFYDSLQSGLTILNVPSYWLDLAEGLVLLAAVVADQMRRNRQRRGRRERRERLAVAGSGASAA